MNQEERIQFHHEKSIYLQIVEKIHEEILLGKYRPGQKLPSVREWAKEYRVNPNTMQRALQELEQEGLVVTQRTSGRYVHPDKGRIEQIRQETICDKIGSFCKEMERLGVQQDEWMRFCQERWVDHE